MLASIFLFAGAAHPAVILDNKNTLDTIVKLAEQRPAKGQLSYYVFRFNAKKFSQEKAIEELNNDYNVRPQKNKRGCHYNIVSGSKKNSLILMNDNSGQGYTKKIAELLEDLNQQGQLVTIVSALWDGQSRAIENGDANSCMVYEFNVYTVDGFKLTLEFNQID